MSEEASRTCSECQGRMSPIIIMDQNRWGGTGPGPQLLEYRLPEDKRSTGRARTRQPGQCGRLCARSVGGSPCLALRRTPNPLLHRTAGTGARCVTSSRSQPRAGELGVRPRKIRTL